MTGEAFGNKRPDKKCLVSALTNNLHIFQGFHIHVCMRVCAKSYKLTISRQCLYPSICLTHDAGVSVLIASVPCCPLINNIKSFLRLEKTNKKFNVMSINTLLMDVRKIYHQNVKGLINLLDIKGLV